MFDPGPDPGTPIIAGSRATAALTVAQLMVHAAADILAGIARHAEFTYSPKTRTIYNAEIPGHALALFREAVEGGRDLLPDRPVYVIAVSNHVGLRLDPGLIAAYRQAATMTNQPMLGHWRLDDREYLDAVVIARFKSDEEAMEFARRYEQHTIFKIKPNGRAEQIRVR